jgi:large subunit ribosomal protein L13
MLLTNKEEIIQALNKQFEEATDSAITWLSDTFSVPAQDDSIHKEIKTISVKFAPVERNWFKIDAKGKALHKVATTAVSIIQGKNKATYEPNKEVDNYVVIINADKIIVTGKKTQQKTYYRYPGYKGGLKTQAFKKIISRQLLVRHLESDIKRILFQVPMGRKLLKKVEIYTGTKCPHSIQNLTAIELIEK